MYTFDSRIRYSETDSEGRLTLSALLNYFQDCSTFQSEDSGLGFVYMREKKLVWLLSSWQIVAERYPRLGDRVTIGTMPYQFRHFLGCRNFFMTDENGNYLAKANSLWILTSAETGQPATPLPEILEKFPTQERLPMEYAPRKIKVLQEGRAMEPIPVGPQFLDTNHHVNNGQYVSIAEGFLPEGILVRQMRAEYKKQAFLGDVFYPSVARQDNLFWVSLLDREGGEYAVVEFETVQSQGNLHEHMR